MIFWVSYSIIVLPVISSTLTFVTPFNLAIACWRLSALKSAHVLHPVQSVFKAFKITFSILFCFSFVSKLFTLLSAGHLIQNLFCQCADKFWRQIINNFVYSGINN